MKQSYRNLAKDVAAMALMFLGGMILAAVALGWALGIDSWEMWL